MSRRYRRTAGSISATRSRPKAAGVTSRDRPLFRESAAQGPAKVRRHRPDVGLVLLIGALLAIGLVVIYSVSPVLSHELLEGAGSHRFFYLQLLHVAVGIAGFIVAAQLPLRWWRKLLPWLGGLTFVLLSLMLIPGLGITEGGATRWLDLGLTTFQPAELVKLLVVVAASVWFAGLSKAEVTDMRRALLPVVAVLALTGAFVLLHQRDLGTMLVIAAIVTVIFFIRGAPWRHMGALLGLGAIGGTLSVLLVPHRLERLQTFFQPEGGLAESSYHLHQALIAVGSGGLFGLGLGGSVQVYGYLPEAANDSIFAIIAETFGLVGALAVIMLFGLLLQRCFVIARRAPDTFSRLLVVGVATWIAIQTMVNIMAMIGIIPLTGITLPFISYGGSSLVLVMVAMGIVTQVSRHTVRSPHEDRPQRRRQRRSSDADFSHRPSPQISR